MFGENTVSIAVVITFLAFRVNGELVEGNGGVKEEEQDDGDARFYLDNFASESTDYVDNDIEKEFDYFYNLEMMKKLENNSLDDSFVDEELDILYEDPDIYDEEVQRYMYEFEPDTTDSESYEDSEEFDSILEDLLLEEDLLESDVDRLDIEIFQPESVDDPIKTEKEKTMINTFNLNIILLALFLVSFVIIIIMTYCTIYNRYRRLVNTEYKTADKDTKSRKNVLESPNKKVLGEKKKRVVFTSPQLWV